ncbi:MAG: hypothetical protein ACOCW0_03775 [Halanaerobium sp.]
MVLGVSSGVMAQYDYEDESTSFNVGVEIDTYAEFDLDDVNVATSNGIEPGEDYYNGDDAAMSGDITANYDFNIFVESEGLKNEEGEELTGVEYLVSNNNEFGDASVEVEHESFQPGGDSGHAFNMDQDDNKRDTNFEFYINFDSEKSWEEFTAGEYSDVVTVTLQAQ